MAHPAQTWRLGTGFEFYPCVSLKSDKNANNFYQKTLLEHMHAEGTDRLLMACFYHQFNPTWGLTILVRNRGSMTDTVPAHLIILGDANTHISASGIPENGGIQTMSISCLTVSSSLQQRHQTQQYRIEQHTMPSPQPPPSAKDLFSAEMLKIKMRSWRQRIHLT